jgi:hypothetical protein
MFDHIKDFGLESSTDIQSDSTVNPAHPSVPLKNCHAFLPGKHGSMPESDSNPVCTNAHYKH